MKCAALRYTLPLLLAFSASGVAHAQTKVYEDALYIYLKTPLNELASKERNELIQQSVDSAVQELGKIVLDKPEDNVIQKSALLAGAKEKTAAMISALDTYINYQTDKNHGYYVTDVIPSGFIVAIGGKFTMSWGLGDGGSAMLGAVIVPHKITRINKLTKKVTSEKGVDLSFIGMVSGDVLASADSGASFRFGVGAIWGQLNDPDEFKGASAAVSTTRYKIVNIFKRDLGVGINLKGGYLKKISASGGFVYAMASAEIGIKGGSPLHGNATAIVSLDSLFQGILSSADPVGHINQSINNNMPEQTPTQPQTPAQPASQSPQEEIKQPS